MVSDTGTSQPEYEQKQELMAWVRSYFLAYEWLVQRHVRVNGVRREDISPVWSMTYGATAGYALWAS